jgi:hypothetical protein
MIINNFDIRCSNFGPSKADTPLIVYSNTVPARAVPFEKFESISRRNFQVCQESGDLQLSQFTTCNRSNIYESLNAVTVGQ